MKLSVSHIGWPFEKSDIAFNKMAELGVKGLEIAPSKVWQDTWNIPFKEVERFRKRVEKNNLKIVGLHALLFDHPELGLFKESEVEKKTIDFLRRLGKLCSDLGGKTLVFGSGQCRNRGSMPLNEAMDKATDFFLQVAVNMQKEGVVMCIEQLDTNETDFINTAKQSLELIKKVGHTGFQGQLDTKSIHASNEIELKLFEDFYPYLKHVHVNDPGLVEVGSTGLINHMKIGKLLKSIEYDGFVSIEQKTINSDSPFNAVVNSVKEVKRCYLDL